MCEWAVSKMYKTNSLGKREYITPYTKDQVDELLNKNSIKLDNNDGYDYVYVANMAKADFLGSALIDEIRLAKFVKDYVDDKDGYDGLPFTIFLPGLMILHVLYEVSALSNRRINSSTLRKVCSL